jgi:asparagine synthase (glutamine-hydrolysing)
MRIAALISGGKDSLYAAYLESKNNELVCLITFKSKRDDSYMFHIPNIELVKVQAKALNLPLIFVESSGIKEKELVDIRKSLIKAKKRYKIEGIVSGALASQYQKSRIDKICKELKLKSLAPLWNIEPEVYMHDLMRNRFEVIITGIAACGLDKNFLGRKIDEELFNKLKEVNKKTGIHIGFEGGEAESFVLDCPMFNKKIRIINSKIRMENSYTGKLVIKKVKLIKKSAK